MNSTKRFRTIFVLAASGLACEGSTDPLGLDASETSADAARPAIDGGSEPDRFADLGSSEDATLPPSRCEGDVPTGHLSADRGSGACVGGVGYRCFVDGRFEIDQRFCPLCSNECIHASDNECDDGGPNATSSGCALGTDCADCGERWQGAPGEKRCEGPRIIATNEDLTSLEGCTHLSYWLQLTGNVTDLSAIADLREIEQDLIVDGTSNLTVLDLPNLERLGHLQLWYTQGLQEVSLPMLHDITRNKNSCSVLCGGVRVQGNASLSAFNLEHVPVAQMQIQDNPSLVTVGPFENMTSATLWLSGNDALGWLNGFPRLANAGTIEIRGNAGLAEIYGFDVLDSVGSDLEISGNDRLEAIRGFSALRTVTEELRILSNSNLMLIEGFDNLKRAGSFVCGGPVLDPSVCAAIEARLVD